MFTGLIEARGRVAAAGMGKLSVSTPWSGLRRGESLSVSGVCLTVTGVRGKRCDLDVVPETLSKTNLGRLKPGDRVNLERAMRARPTIAFRPDHRRLRDGGTPVKAQRKAARKPAA